MGSEINCSMKFGGKVFKGKALLETDELIFRGEHRLTIPFKKMKSVEANDGELRVFFEDGIASFILDKKAEQWEEKILHPKSVLDKLGVKEDSRVSVDGVTDENFLGQLKDKTDCRVSNRTAKRIRYYFLCGGQQKRTLEDSKG